MAMTTFQPSWIMATMCRHVSWAAMYWSATVWCCLSLISELPPIATTAVPGVSNMVPMAFLCQLIVRAITAFWA